MAQNNGDGGTTSPAEVQEYLGGLNYPADKNQLIQYARNQEAPKNVLDLLAKLPDRQYGSPINVTEEIGKIE